MRGGGEGSAITDTVSATLGVMLSSCPSEAADRHALLVALLEHPVEPGLQARGLQVVEQVLGLVLEAHHPHRRPHLDVGQGDAREAAAGHDRVAVGAGLGVADGGHHALLQHGRHRVLQALGLLVDLVPGHPEDVGEEALDHAVAAHDVLRVRGPRTR